MFTEPRAKAEVLNSQLSSVFNTDKANGPDRIPPWFLKEIHCPVNFKGSCWYLLRLYQYRNYAQPMKTSNVFAIHKKGKKSDSSNYRSVSLNCMAWKVLVLSTLCTAMLRNTCRNMECSLITNMALKAKRSTETELICTIHAIASAIQSNKTIHAAILDFSKAFDKVPYVVFWRNLTVTKFVACFEHSVPNQ